MKDKREIKVSLGTVICIVIITFLVSVIGLMWYYYNYVEDKAPIEESVDTNKSTEDTIENALNSKYTEITKELEGMDVLFVTEAIENSNNTYTLKGVIYTQYTISSVELNNILEKGSMTIEGEEYTIKNSDNTGEYDLFVENSDYALYKLKMLNNNEYYLEAQAQIADVWKLTNEYKEITVSNDTKCSLISDYEEEYNTVEKVFNNFEKMEPIETTNPNTNKSFIFQFENGECVEVINVLTAV